MKEVRNRDVVKNQHEEASIQDALDLLNRSHGTKYKIIERPDPPDAIVFDGKNYSWIEHVDAFRSPEEAKELMSYVTPGEVPYHRSEQLIDSPDERILYSVQSAMLSKLKKSSYEPYYKKYGKGILIISEQDPLFSDSTIALLEQEMDTIISGCIQHEDRNLFEKVYLKFRLSGWAMPGLMAIYPKIEPIIAPQNT